MAISNVSQSQVVRPASRPVAQAQPAPAKAATSQDQLSLGADPARQQVLAALASGEKPVFRDLGSYKDFARSAVQALKTSQARLAAAQPVLESATAARTAKEKDVNFAALSQAVSEANEAQLDALQPGRHQAEATLKETEAMATQLGQVEQKIVALENSISRDEALNRQTERNLRDTELSNDRTTANVQVLLGAGAVAGLAASKAGIAKRRQEIVSLTGQRVQIETQIQTKQALAQQYAARPGVPSQVEAATQKLDAAKQALAVADAAVKPLRDREQLAAQEAATAKGQADKASALVSHLKDYDAAIPGFYRTKWTLTDRHWKQGLDSYWQSLT